MLSCVTILRTMMMENSRSKEGRPMTDKKPKPSRMVYTPECHIPIGEAIVTDNGEYALRIKKPKSQEVEVISIGKLMTQVAQAAQSTI